MSEQRRMRAHIKNQIIPSIYRALLDEMKDLIEEEKTRRKKFPLRPWIADRETPGGSSPLLTEIATEEVRDFRECLRMTSDEFETLLAMVSPKIQKQDTLMREAIPAKVKLEVTLSFLATGTSYRSLHRFYRVSKPAISNFIPEVCDAIYKSLRDFIKVPSNHVEWETISNGFRDNWNFPMCCGAIDGKHIIINDSDKGSNYSYKGMNSIVLIALVDHRYCFSYFEIGNRGSESDKRVFENCKLLEPLENGILPNGSYLLGNDAFPLKPYSMKPYTNRSRPLSQEENIFNYRLSRVKRIADNVFGILFSRFRVFDQKMDIKLKTVNKLVSAACALHNWLVINSGTTYLFHGAVDEENYETGEIIPGQWRSEIRELGELEKYEDDETNTSSQQVRDQLREYFSNEEGVVPWQFNATFGVTKE